MRRLRTILIWGLVSILMQVGFLYYIERQVRGDVQASSQPQPQTPIIINTSVRVPQAAAKNVQASYNKDYLVFSDNQGFKVLKIKTGTVVFQENKPAKGDILGYSWLPDRNTLLFVTAKPNPTKPAAVVPKPQTSKPPTQTSEQPPGTEDPASKTPTPETAPAPINPQLTELYAVDFFPPDQEIPPDRKLGRILDTFPAGATVQSMEFSTYTNLIYLLVKTTYGQIIYEIDVMRNIRTVNRSGETISRMVASDKKGTLYVQSKLYNVAQIVSVRHNGRDQVLKGSQYILVGVDAGKLLIGQVENDELTAILNLEDLGSEDKVTGNTSTVWSGRIPWKTWTEITVSNNIITFFDGMRVVILDNGKEKSVSLTGAENYLTSDGREAIEVSPNGDGTVQVVIKPL